ncbi:MAG: hypothetical protein QXW13_00715 [Nanopusillaceae archaeon]
MKIKSTSYPAIALLVSLIILISGFAVAMFGVNTYLEEKREYGLELLEDFKNYNYFQFYTYVLSDYEVRKIFFETLYKEILNNSIVNGVLNPTIYNNLLLNKSKINEYIPNCEKIFELVVDNFTNIFGNTIFLYFPCFEIFPIINFTSELNKSFIDKLILNYLNNDVFEKHAEAIYNYTKLTINIEQKNFNVEEDDILFYQNLRYFYKGKKEKFTRSFNISISYSLIPNIFLYIKLFSEDYKSILEDVLRRIAGSEIYNISKFKNYIDGSFRLSFGNETFLILYKNHSKEAKMLNFVRNLYNLSQVVPEIYFKYQEIYLCEQIEAYSNSTYQLSYENIHGCNISKTPDKLRMNLTNQYLIETCLYDDYYYLSDYVDESWAEICFYKFYKDELMSGNLNLNRFPEAFIPPFYGSILSVSVWATGIEMYYMKKSEGHYLWAIEEIPVYKVIPIGKYVPTKCVLGYRYVDGPHIYYNKTECENKRSELIQQYGMGGNPYIFVSDCEEIILNISLPFPLPIPTPLPSPIYRVYVGNRSKVITSNFFMFCGSRKLNQITLGVYVPKYFFK